MTNMEKLNKKEIFKKIDQEKRQALKDCWNYHKYLLEESDIKKSNLEDDLYNCELTDWEDVGYFVGYLRGLEDAKLIINNEI